MISSVLKRALKQKAVYWGAPVDDGWGGQTFATPVEINCRWTDSITKDHMTVVRTANGTEVISIAEVYIDQDLEEEGWLWLGLLADLSTAQKVDPMKAGGAYMILKFGKVPDIQNNEVVRKAYL